jgi:hypothetical protein
VVRPPDGGFTIELPAPPDVKEAPVLPEGAYASSTVWISQRGAVFCMLRRMLWKSGFEPDVTAPRMQVALAEEVKGLFKDAAELTGEESFQRFTAQRFRAACPAFTMFRDTLEALGWLYVIERRTLLHDGVRKNLLERIPTST